ncbi:hypothetical protein Lal_00042561 [Lupinus albus]|uniref:ATP-dependent DNA helicase n=1 Tax=Lupinus albus TaxID=3870 RepID=A0A6A5N3J7_LUPAL|nr:putative DNA helicase Pif1 [Lupinus albus]KAF1881846.1 hypothetical protein Lal_00042561 [Lupinus albus]
MWRTLATALRSENHIVLTVASSGIASLLLPEGQHIRSLPYLFQLLKTLLATFIKGVISRTTTKIDEVDNMG